MLELVVSYLVMMEELELELVLILNFIMMDSHSIINDSAGSLLVRSNVVQISTPAGSKYFKGQNGIANLYYSDSKKLETSAKGIKVGTGVTIETNGQATFVGVVTFGSGSTTIDDNVVNVGTALTLGHTQGLPS